MKKLNIIKQAAAGKIIQFETFDSPDDKPGILYAYTDGKGNYALSKDNSIWYADKSNKNMLDDGQIDGDPIKLYKGSPQLSVARVNGKLGVWDLATLKLIEGPYKDMDALVEDLRDGILEDNINYLEFDYE